MTGIKTYAKYLNLLLLLLVGYLGYLLIKPFLLAIIAATIVAYIFFPLYRILFKKTKRRNLSAFLSTLFVILLLTIPSLIAINAITKETYLFYLTAKQRIDSGDIFEVECETGTACKIINYIKEKAVNPEIKFYLQDIVKRFSSYIIDNASKIPSKIASIALNLFVMFFSMFFIFRDGEQAMKDIGRAIPMKDIHQKKIIKRFGDVTGAVIYGSIITAVIQGVVGALGFWIFGVSSPLLWGLVMILAALIPFVGTPLIWIPAGLIMILNGYFEGNSLIIGKGIGLLVYGFVFISSIDNFLKPKIVGARGSVHPLLVLLGVLGGLQLFGIIGFIIGPLILAFSFTFLKIYQEQITK